MNLFASQPHFSMLACMFFWNGKNLLKTVYQHEMKITISFQQYNWFFGVETKRKGSSFGRNRVHELIVIATLLASLIKSDNRALVSLRNSSTSVCNCCRVSRRVAKSSILDNTIGPSILGLEGSDILGCGFSDMDGNFSWTRSLVGLGH